MSTVLAQDGAGTGLTADFVEGLRVSEIIDAIDGWNVGFSYAYATKGHHPITVSSSIYCKVCKLADPFHINPVLFTLVSGSKYVDRFS